MNPKTKKKIIDTTLSVVIWFLVLLFYLIPFYYMIVNSLKTKKEASTLTLNLPTEWRFENYSEAFTRGRMLTALINNGIVAAIVILIVVVCGMLGAFYIQRAQTKIASFLYYFSVMGIAMPISITTTFDLLKSLRLYDTLIGASFICAAMRLPFIVFLYVGFMKTVPKELDEAAIIDGCGPARLFFRIILPLLKPITITSIVITAQFVWNTFDVFIYFLQSSARYTLPLSVYSFYGMYGSDRNMIFSCSVITVIPILIVYLLGQRYIIDGLTTGAVKG